MRIEYLVIGGEGDEHITNSDSWKMEDLARFLLWLINERGAVLQLDGAEPDGDALGAVVKHYVMHGPYSDEAQVRAMFEKQGKKH